MFTKYEGVKAKNNKFPEVWVTAVFGFQANYTKYMYNADGKTTKEDSRASRAALPRFVDKALQLLNLNQVVGEVETSVMSKMSCTACKAGAGLLQHYIKAGKTRDDIVKITYQFCTSFKLQTPRVCEGITEMFSVSNNCAFSQD